MLVKTVGVTVLEQADEIAVDRVGADLVAHPADHKVATLLDRAGGEVVVEPVHMTAIVFNALMNSMRLGNEDATLRVEAERDWIGQLRLARHRCCGESFRQTNRRR
jgi:hypothetical protein